MRILSQLFLCLLVLASSPAWAVKKGVVPPVSPPVASTSLFEVDDAALEAEFAELTLLEAEVSSNGLTYSELVRSHETFESDIPRLANVNYNGDWRDPLLNMDPFWFTTSVTCVSWIAGLGCIAGPAAVIYVYIDSDKDKSATTSSAMGCVLGNLPVAVGYVLYIALIVSVNTM